MSNADQFCLHSPSGKKRQCEDENQSPNKKPKVDLKWLLNLSSSDDSSGGSWSVEEWINRSSTEALQKCCSAILREDHEPENPYPDSEETEMTVTEKLRRCVKRMLCILCCTYYDIERQNFSDSEMLVVFTLLRRIEMKVWDTIN